jgi:GNAT superfamily N-acetyltransferase
VACVLVRTVTAMDHDRWLPLWEGYNRFYGRHGDTALPAEVTRTTWARFLDPAEPVHAIVAELGGESGGEYGDESDGAPAGELVGIAHFLFHRSTISVRPTCYLQDLFTAERARGRGAGRALIEEVARRAAGAGSERLYWHTHETNATARSLYDRLAERSGFIVYRRPC